MKKRIDELIKKYKEKVIEHYKWLHAHPELSGQEKETASYIANELRKRGVSVDFDHMNRGIKAQFKYADKIGAKFVAVIGETELEKNALKVKEMQTGEETEISLDSVVNYILSK